MTTNWTGKDAGARKPMTGETPLSPSEVAVGLREGHFTAYPAPNEPEQRRIVAVPSQLQRATRNRETTSALQAAMLPLIQQAGAEGIENVALAKKLGQDRRNVNHRSQELRFRGLIHTYTNGHSIRHFHASVPVEAAEARMLAVAAERAATRAERQLATKRKYDAKRRAAKAAGIKMETRAERAKRSDLERQQEAEARAAVRLELAQAKQLAKDLARLEKQEAAKKPKAPPATRKATRDINKIADKYRGTVSVSPIPQPKPKPVAGPLDFPEDKIQRWAPKLMWHEQVKPAGVISRTIGVYEGEPSICARAVAA
jgi:hypothetical protein